jgi:transposase
VTVEVLHSRCAGFDVHKDSVMVCLLIDRADPVIRRFGTTTRELLLLRDFLAGHRIGHVAMESTGVYWKPIWNVLEDGVKLMLVNAQHIKQVPGRKTDVGDCQWIADLLRHGLIRPSFVPPPPQRDLRELTRQRSQLVAERARAANRVRKVLEGANLKLGSVVSDILGKSSRAMIGALIEDPDADPAELAERLAAAGPLRNKIPQLALALKGALRDHHRFMLKQLLDQADHLGEQIEAFEARIDRMMGGGGGGGAGGGGDADGPFARAAARLDSIPGINRRAAQAILAEIGHDMSRFASAAHLASWAGLCPGNDESAGKRRSGHTRFGNRWLKQMLVQCAWAAARTKRSYFHGTYQRLRARRGHKRALIAIAHAMLGTIWHLLSRGSDYVDRASVPKHQPDPQRLTQHLVQRLQQLGYTVALSPAA